MQKIGWFFFLSLALMATSGCNNEKNVKIGDRFEVLENLRVPAATEWEEPYNDGFTAQIPKGAILEARFTITPGSSYFECIPVKVNTISGHAAMMQYFVPESIKNKKGFKGFSISLPVKDIGVTLKKIE
jgi:hypothetical protein